MVAPERDVEPADPRENRGRQEVLLRFAAFQLLAGNTDALAEAQEQGTMPQYRARRALEVGIADFGMDDVDEFFMDLGIMDAGQLAAHQFGRVDRDVICEDSPRFLCPDLDRF